MIAQTDIIYGKFQLEGVIAELCGSAAMQRLKGIHQGGAIFLVDPKQAHTRFEHSLGVFWLVRHLGGRSEEQIAALLHDISHTVFSHVGDQALQVPGEDHHEQIYQQVIQSSDIPAIIQRHGYGSVLDSFDSYTLLERPAPELCADRVDYILRDSFYAGFITKSEANAFLEQLTVAEGKMVCRSLASDQWLRELSKTLSEQYFKKPEYLYANSAMADILRRALADKILFPADLQLTDAEVLVKLQSNYETELQELQNLSGLPKFEINRARVQIKERSLI